MAIEVVSAALRGISTILPIIKKYLDQPKLHIELRTKSRSSSPQGHVYDKNNIVEHELEDGRVIQAIDANKSKQVFEIEISFDLTITNQSEAVAYYPKMHLIDGARQLVLEDKVTSTPIRNTSEIKILGRTKSFEIKLGENRSHGKEINNKMEDFRLLLEYKNEKGLTYYTLFDYQNKKKRNDILWKFPKNLKTIPIEIE